MLDDWGEGGATAIVGVSEMDSTADSSESSEEGSAGLGSNAELARAGRASRCPQHQWAAQTLMRASIFFSGALCVSSREW